MLKHRTALKFVSLNRLLKDLSIPSSVYGMTLWWRNWFLIWLGTRSHLLLARMDFILLTQSWLPWTLDKGTDLGHGLVSNRFPFTFSRTQDIKVMNHQWIEGNLPMAAKCVVCDKTCGSVLRYVRTMTIEDRTKKGKRKSNFNFLIVSFFWVESQHSQNFPNFPSASLKRSMEVDKTRHAEKWRVFNYSLSLYLMRRLGIAHN